MITETQLTEIRNYLLSKKLPIDILIEVNDHFISQINDLQKKENLNFEEAFEKVKEKLEEKIRLEEERKKQLLANIEANLLIRSNITDTDAIITECAKSDHRVIGNINYPITKNPKVEFKIGQRSMTYTGLGEFHMAFISKKNIDPKQAKTAVENFAKEGSTPAITTPWANVTSTESVVELTLLENLRLLSEGTGKFGFSLSNSYLVI